MWALRDLQGLPAAVISGKTDRAFLSCRAPKDSQIPSTYLPR